MKARLLGVATLLCAGVAQLLVAPIANANTIDYAPNGLVGRNIGDRVRDSPMG